MQDQETMALIAELRDAVELGRLQATRLRNLLKLLLEHYGLADELRSASDAQLFQLGLSVPEIAALRDVLLPLRHFSWLGDYRVAGSARPLSRAGVEALVAEGIRTVVTLTAEPLPAGWLDGLALDVAHIPLPDVLPAPLPDLHRAVATIERGLGNGHAVAVHCAAGIGRTGTVLAAFLVAQGLSPEEAVATLQRLRPRSAVSVENRAVLEQFARERRARR